jgi:hypothetical protein
MSIFSKKPPAERSLPDRLRDFRARVEEAMRDCNVPGQKAAAVLDDLAKGLRVYAAMTTAPESTRPVYHSGNLPEKRGLRALIGGR